MVPLSAKSGKVTIGGNLSLSKVAFAFTPTIDTEISIGLVPPRLQSMHLIRGGASSAEITTAGEGYLKLSAEELFRDLPAAGLFLRHGGRRAQA